jgi:hypothetical protein
VKRLTFPELRSVLLNSNSDQNPEDLLKPMLKGLEESQVFDFGQLEGDFFDNVDRELTAELWHRRLLRLPFKRVVFVFKKYGVRFYFVGVDDSLVQFDKEDTQTATAFAIVTQRDDDTRADAFCWFTVPDTKHISAGATELSWVPAETSTTFKEFSLGSMSTLMNLCMLLNTKGVPKRHEPAPIRLNVKRQRQGKPPLPSVTYVDLDRVSFAGSVREGGGGIKSMHLRRGHIRRFDDGTVTWVRDCIVKADGDLKQRERYQLSRHGASHGQAS